MAKSTGIVLTAGGVAFANEWLQTNTPNFRIPIATLGVAFLFAGIERINTKAGVGLAWMMLILALTTPINGKAPAQTVLVAMQQPKKGAKK
jgi:hypothetical protein